MSGSRILIVEDDPAIRSAAGISLRKIGHEVRGVGTLKEGEAALAQPTDLLVLDLNLPDGNGLDLCRKLAALPGDKGGVPVFIITARGSTDDVVEGLEAGAEDYMVKPFNMREFLARVRALLRRRAPKAQGETDLVAGKLRLSEESHEAWCGGKPLELTLREFELLAVLIGNPGKVLSRQELIALAWGASTATVLKVIDVHIGHLRAKLGKDSKMIETVPQVGFKLVVPKR
jgi:DNA-binding response OmpR family regulator